MRGKAIATLVLSLCATGCWSAAAWAMPRFAASLGISERDDWGLSYADDGSRAYVSGIWTSLSGPPCSFLTCLKTTGDHLWTITFDETQHIYDLAPADAGVVVLTDNSPEVIRLDQDGKVVWKKRMHDVYSVGYGLLRSIKRTGDGGYILCGWWTDNNTRTIDKGLLVKITSGGVLQWSKTYAMSCEPGVWAYGFGTVELSADGGHLAAGQTWSSDKPVGARIIKTDRNGNLLWERKIVTKNGYEWGSPIPAPDGGCFYAGYRYSDSKDYAGGFVVRLDSAGKLLWARSIRARLFALGMAAFNGGRFGVPTPDGGLVLAASILNTTTCAYDPSLRKIDSAGSIVWRQSQSFGKMHGLVNSAFLTKEGGIVWCGMSATFPVHEWDILVLRCNANGELGGACPTWAGQVSLTDLKVKVKPVSAQAKDQPVPFLDVSIERHRMKMPTRILCRSEDAR